MLRVLLYEPGSVTSMRSRGDRKTNVVCSLAWGFLFGSSTIRWAVRLGNHMWQWFFFKTKNERKICCLVMRTGKMHAKVTAFRCIVNQTAGALMGRLDSALCSRVGCGLEPSAKLVWQKRLVKMSHLCLQTVAVPQAETLARPLSSVLTWDLDLLSTARHRKQI